jgi:ADP-ribosylglycohydrolase
MVDHSGTIRGGIFGHLLGDAAGVPYEFKPAGLLVPWSPSIDMIPPKNFPRTHPVPNGTWSDDGSLMLCLLDSLIETGEFNPVDQMRRSIRWMTEGYLAVGGHVFDIGNTTAIALRRGAELLEEGRSPEMNGESHDRSQGNGSLMRILPLALWHRGDASELVEWAMIQSSLTHAHPTCLVCCAIYCLWVRNILDGVDQPFDTAIDELKAMRGDDPSLSSAFETLDEWSKRIPAGTGLVVDTLFSARWAVESGGTFKDVIRRSILLGNDTDTTAAVAGGIAGIIVGEAGLPDDWMQVLRDRDRVEPMAARLASMRGS